MPRSRNSVELPEADDEDGVAAEPAAERRGLAVGRQDTEHSLVTRRRDADRSGRARDIAFACVTIQSDNKVRRTIMAKGNNARKKETKKPKKDKK